jgi:MFS family permease
MKKWIEIILSMVLMLFMGSIYAYSVFRSEVMAYYNINLFLSGLPYMTALAFYAISMFVTGKIIKRDNTSLIAVLGLLTISLGFLVASLSNQLWMLIAGYGVFAGFGVGLTYSVPIFRLQQRKSKHTGFYTGLILLGFGASPLVTANLIKWFLSFGLKEALLYMSILFLVLSPIGLIYHKEAKIKRVKYKVIWDRPFMLLYMLFVLGTSVGLMMIGLSLQVGTLYAFNLNHITLLLSIFAVFNGLSRPLFGYLMDKYGFKFSAMLSIGLIILASIIGLINQGQSILLYGISFSLYWFNLGAFLSLMPQVIKTYYGKDLYASYYGVLFTAYGVAALFGHLLSGVILDYVGKTVYLYLAILVVSLMALWIIKRLSLSLKIRVD